MNDWPIRRIKYVAGINQRSLNEDQDPDLVFRYIDIATVGRGVLTTEPSKMLFKDAPSRARRLVAPGDTIVSTVRTYLRAVWPVVGNTDDLVVSTGFAVLTPTSHLYPPFLGWWAQSDPFVEEIVARSVGVGYPAINATEIGNIYMPVPPIQTQQAIASYLDREIARIEALISAEKKRLDLASERLAAAIQTLVLGREGASDKSNSSVSPLVPIPHHWTWRRNKTFLREIVDLSEFGDEELLSVSHITGVTPRSEKDVTMFLAESNEGYKRVRQGDLVVNTMWAWMGALGVSPCDGIVSPAYGVYRFEKGTVDEGYFNALYRSPAYIAEMTRYSKGVWTSRLRLYPDSFLALRSPFPPLPEQRRIAAQVRELITETEHLVDLFKHSINLLIERRQALITAAVTGELEVPGVVV